MSLVSKSRALAPEEAATLRSYIEAWYAKRVAQEGDLEVGAGTAQSPDPGFYCSYCDDFAEQLCCERCGNRARPMRPAQDSYLTSALCASEDDDAPVEGEGSREASLPNPHPTTWREKP